MIFKLFKKWFSKKAEEKEKRVHSLFFKIPIGARLNGIIKFKSSSSSYFLLNEDKLVTKLPEEKTQVVSHLSRFNLFGLTIYRAYIEVEDSYLQFHYNDINELEDILYFKSLESFVVTNNPKERKKWEAIIGDEDIITPSGIKFLRDWSPDEKGHVYATPVIEMKFSDPSTFRYIERNMMLYSRVIEGGKEDDIEYLLAEIVKLDGKITVKIQTAIRLEATDLDIM
jgi:hypothetical protein